MKFPKITTSVAGFALAGLTLAGYADNFDRLATKHNGQRGLFFLRTVGVVSDKSHVVLNLLMVRGVCP